MSLQLNDWPYPKWIAHRGAGKLAPENTLAAFRLGAQHGYRMFECDARLSSDGVVFLMHDTLLDRTTNGHGVGGEQTWAQLSKWDAGSWHSNVFAGEPLPTLGNIAQFCLVNGYFLNIEIKPTPETDAITGEVVAAQAARLWANAAIPPLLTSFKPEALASARKAAPHLPRGLLLDTLWHGWFEQAEALACAAIVLNYTLWNEYLVNKAHTAGWRCLSYTVNDSAHVHHLHALKTDGVITDCLDLFDPAS